SDTSRMKSRSCSTMRTAQRALIGPSSSPVRRRSSRLIPAVGSSSRSRVGSVARAMAISSHCCSPWESVPARWSTRPRRGKRSIAAMTDSCRARRVVERSSDTSESRLWRASRTLSYTDSAGSTLVIWNLMLRPARARSEGATRVRSRSAKRITPVSGMSAPAMHFMRVLFPDPLGPMSPWIWPASTRRSTPARARSSPKRLLTSATSSSAMASAGLRAGRRPAEAAESLALGHHEPHQAARPEEHDEEEEQAEEDRPEGLEVVGEQEAHVLDAGHPDHRADQRAHPPEEHVEDDLGGQQHAEHVGPHEAVVERGERARKAADAAGQGEDDGLEVLDPVAEKADPLLLLANAREHEAELGAHEGAAERVDDDEDHEGQVVVDGPLRDGEGAGGERRDRGDAVLPAE